MNSTTGFTSKIKISEPSGKILRGVSAISVGPETAIISTTVPVGKTWLFKSSELVFANYSTWRFDINGNTVSGGYTSPAQTRDKAVFEYPLPVPAGQTIELFVEYTRGPNGAIANGFLNYNES